VRVAGVAIRFVMLCCLALAGQAAIAVASDEVEKTSWHEKTSTVIEPKREFWAGVESFRNVWSLYTGSTYALGGNLRQDGFRLRAVSALSHYTYSGKRYNAAVGDAATVNFTGDAKQVDILAGYQWSSGSLTIKSFAGWQITGHAIKPYDPETEVQGKSSGAKGALEIWYNIGNVAWVSLDLAYARPYGAHSHRGRLGWRATETVSLGGELSLIGHIESDIRRVGAFVRYDDGVNEISGQGGWSMQPGIEGSVYVGGQWLRRF
jgi:Cellulose biosynthesis protein BcsS